jgi:hypothetical protein
MRNPGVHQHYFQPNPPTNAKSSMPAAGTFGSNDMLYVYTLVNFTDLPQELMLQFMDETGSWEHRAFWGANNIAWGTLNTGSRRQMSTSMSMPKGTWTRLDIPANQVDMVGHRVVGVAFTLYGGAALWDDVGYRANGSLFETNWIDDELPAGDLPVSYQDDWYWAAAKRNWLQFGGDPAHSGSNSLETQISPANMIALMPMAGFTQLQNLSGGVLGHYAPPILQKDVVVPGQGTHDVLYVNGGGRLYMYDAYLGGAPILASDTPPTGPNLGESSPALDPSLQWVYNVGSDGKLYKYDATTLQTITSWQLPAFPARTAITVAKVGSDTFLYVGTANGSGGVGHVVTIKANASPQTPAQLFSTTAGIWQRGGMPFEAVSERIIATTGDANTIPWNPDGGVWSLSVLALNKTGIMVVDSFTPPNVATLEVKDLDMNSTNTLLLPFTPAYFNYPRLAVQTGKDGQVRVLNLADLSSHGGPATPNGTAVSETKLPTLPASFQCEGLSTPQCNIKNPIATWVNPVDGRVFVFINSALGLIAMRLMEFHSASYLESVWWPTSPPPAANVGGVFAANGVVYYANGSGIHWVDAGTGLDANNVLPPSGTEDHRFKTPVVINGVLYYNGKAWSLAGVPPVKPNRALRRPTSQSSFITSWFNNPDVAVDGNTNGKFYSGSVMHTDNEPQTVSGLTGNGGPWWKVDLGSVMTINTIVLHNRTDDGQARISNFRIAVSSNLNGPYTSVFTSTQQTSAPVLSAFIGNTNARYVMVQSMCAAAACRTDADYLNLAEIQVF